MGKNKNRKNAGRESEATSTGTNIERPSDALTAATTDSPALSSSPRRSIFQWCFQERKGIIWVFCWAVLGAFGGFALGSGMFSGQFNEPAAEWRRTLGSKIRETDAYLYLTLQKIPFEPKSVYGDEYEDDDDVVGARAMVTLDTKLLRSNPSHPTVYAVLREAVVREKGGFVHPDLGILHPAPSGAARGLGMVRNSWHQCQNECNPGTRNEKLAEMYNLTDPLATKNHQQEEVLLKVPLTYQMTRTVALETLLPRISAEVLRKSNIHELDDAALLTLLLAHERGVGKFSRWLPYIASLPLQPSCGYAQELRPYLLDSIQALNHEVGLDVHGWSGKLDKATQYAERIVNGLNRDYGMFLQKPTGVSMADNIEWSLCQVASRAIGGSQKHGALRLIPMADIVNHDAEAGAFVELTGKEKLEHGYFVGATEDDSGTFVLRSQRHGVRKALRVGQELLANYNVAHYSALDWFVSMGFVPSERWSQWHRMEAALPRVRRDGPFGVPGAGGRYQNEDVGASTT